MLKKVIATASSMAIALLASASMTMSVFADDSVATTANFEAEEKSTAETINFVDATTITTEATGVAKVESTVRSDQEKSIVAVRDGVYFEDGVTLIDAEDNTLQVPMGEHIYIVARDEANLRFRVFLPKANRVLYLKDADIEEAQVFTHEAMVVGDLDADGRIDSYDMVLMKRGFLYGWSDTWAYYMADMNADGIVSIGDLVIMQRWLLGDY